MVKKLTIEEAIQQIEDKHPDQFIFDKFVYTSRTSKVILTCKKCNTELEPRAFSQYISSKNGCLICANYTKKTSFLQFKEKVEELNPNMFDWEMSTEISTGFKELHSKVTMYCKYHGKLESRYAYGYYQGKRCFKCWSEIKAQQLLGTHEEFVQRVNETSKYHQITFISEFIGQQENIEAVCAQHGPIPSKKAQNYLQGKVCTMCSYINSKAEIEIREYIHSLGFTNANKARPSWLKSEHSNRSQEIDILIEEKKLAIEYNGTSFHHSSNSKYIVDSFIRKVSKPKNYHFNKWKICFDNDYTLLSIYDFYWNNPIKKEIYKSKIRHYLGLDKKVYARNCKIIEINNINAYKFYDHYHLEGAGFPYANSKSFALVHKETEEILMCATIGEFYDQSKKLKKLKLHRICTLSDITVIGGVTKLFHNLQLICGKFIYQITLSSGGSTLKNISSFKFLPPRYFWVNPKTLEYFHRNQCQKIHLEKRFGKPLLPDDSENTFMERLGFLKVFDNGLAELLI